MKYALAGIAGFVGLVFVAILLHVTGVYVFGSVQRSTAGFRGETEVIEKTRADGSYRIAAYELFFNRCASIQSKQATIAQMEQELAGKPDAQRKAWLEQTLTGLRAGLNTDITRYNADSAKEGTLAQFKDSGLPYRISLTSKEPVVCG